MAEEGWTTVSHAKKPSAPKPRPPRSDDPRSEQVLNLSYKKYLIIWNFDTFILIF